MSEKHVIFGCNGPVGRSLADVLLGKGHSVVGVCRSGTADLGPGATVMAGDAADRERTTELCAGADVIHSCIGIDYRQWGELWMPIVEGLLHAASSSGARLVFTDNLYCYGPQSAPLREDMPLTEWGKKPALRARMVRRMLDAHEAGQVRVVFVRASDFIGPRVTNALLGEFLFGRALSGKAAQFLGDPDLPHSYTYVPDLARAQVRIAGDEEAFGQAWHVPNPPTRNSRAIIHDAYARLEQPARLQLMPGWVLTALGIFNPLMRELKEMQFQWRHPYEVDHSKFMRRYPDFEVTSWDAVLDRTAAWYRTRPSD